ncbi:urease accessory protein UreE [Terrihabitans sp. B22-R8]|uniref:urease accessory protein UreE n=1 Tax=Terrihabitans sp. B22-R8 TaxID=3425128 RepID=UPI00403C7D39
MNRATQIVRKLAVKPADVAGTITLDHQSRHRRRMAMTTDQGLEFLLDLGTASVTDDGDAVKLDDGRLIQIVAANEDLIEVTTSNPLRLMKLAWHLGNRHVPAEITKDAIYFAPDHVLVEMVRGLGGSAEPVKRPFRPERGAYHEHTDHGHGSTASRDVLHVHGDDRPHVHEHHENEHGHQCGCGHHHD